LGRDGECFALGPKSGDNNTRNNNPEEPPGIGTLRKVV